MRLSQLKQERQDAEREAEVPILDISGNPYCGTTNGKPDKTKPTVFLVIGEYSERYQAAVEELSGDEELALLATSEDDATKQARARAIKKVAVGVVGWRHVETDDFQPVPFTLENVIQVLTAAPWIANRVLYALRRHTDFFVGRSSS